MSARTLLLALLLPALLLTACSDDKYGWTRVPYCKLPPNTWGSHFSTRLRVLTKHDDGYGVSSLHGMRPQRSLLFDDELLVAVVACAAKSLRLDSATLAERMEAFDAEHIPSICRGQRTLVAPVQLEATPIEQTPHAAAATTGSGFQLAGTFAFPAVPVEALSCRRGSLAYGRGW